MRANTAILLFVVLMGFSVPVNAARIDINDFSGSAIQIDFSDIQSNDPNSGNGALTPIAQYSNLGVIFNVKNQEDFVGTRHDVFRLGGFAGDGLSIATNVGDDASIELVFDFPVSQIGASVALSNTEFNVYGGGGTYLEGFSTLTVPNGIEFVGIENSEGIKSATFTDISPNGLIMALDNVLFTPGFDAVVNTDQTYLTDYLALGDTFTFDYWWDMVIEPTEGNFDVLFFNGTQWETFGWELNFGGSSEQWQTAEFWVPEWARGDNVQIMFSLLDWGQVTDPTVYLRNIGSETAPVPEPAT